METDKLDDDSNNANIEWPEIKQNGIDSEKAPELGKLSAVITQTTDLENGGGREASTPSEPETPDSNGIHSAACDLEAEGAETPRETQQDRSVEAKAADNGIINNIEALDSRRGQMTGHDSGRRIRDPEETTQDPAETTPDGSTRDQDETTQDPDEATQSKPGGLEQSTRQGLTNADGTTQEEVTHDETSQEDPTGESNSVSTPANLEPPNNISTEAKDCNELYKSLLKCGDAATPKNGTSDNSNLSVEKTNLESSFVSFNRTISEQKEARDEKETEPMDVESPLETPADSPSSTRENSPPRTWRRGRGGRYKKAPAKRRDKRPGGFTALHYMLLMTVLLSRVNTRKWRSFTKFPHWLFLYCHLVKQAMSQYTL